MTDRYEEYIKYKKMLNKFESIFFENEIEDELVPTLDYLEEDESALTYCTVNFLKKR